MEGVGEQAELVLFPEVVKGAKSRPEVLKRQHPCSLIYAEKHGIKPVAKVLPEGG